MTIMGFNPNMNVEQFQQVVKAEASTEEQVKKATFVALAGNKVEKLTEGLSADLIEKIQGYAQEREKQLNACVRQLNASGDCKDDLSGSSEAYKVSKKAREAARDAYYALMGLDAVVAHKTVEALEGQRAALSKVFAKFKRAEGLCCEQSPIVVIQNAMHGLEGKKDEKQQQEQIESLCSALRWWYLDNNLEPSYELKGHLTKYTTYPASTLEVLDQQMPIAKKQAEEVKAKREAEKGAKIAQNKEALEKNIMAYQGAKEKRNSEEGYQQYTAKKQACYKVLQEVSAFCTISELTTHPKINNDSQRIIWHKAKVATTH